jgi:spore maturation protein CgeB
MTGGIVEYVKSYEDFIERYHYFLEHPEECAKKMELGYEWSKKYGTNRYAASLFLDKIRELWN